ncbi:hypothetical protein R3P38DRAFT_2874963 [Favolaschia claudopus]|uniref:Uncharacterized protein n=1 Tax=Favolaschia claudopus TaxID=2862362 RepID=A0AAW0D6L2_9AGAR
MLPLRSVLRSTPRTACQRPISRLRPLQLRNYYVPTARSSTWSARVWYRADGTPRSKVRGLVIATILSGLLYATWSTLLVVEALDYEHYLLSTLVHIQRVDYDYSTIPFATSYAASVQYFADMCAYLAHSEGDISPEMLERFFNDIAAFDDSEPTRSESDDDLDSLLPSSSSLPPSNPISNSDDPAPSVDAEREPDLTLNLVSGQRRSRAHLIIIAASASVHDILARSKGANAADTASHVLDVIDQALIGLIALSEDVGEDVRDQLRKLRVQLGAGSKEKGYEVLG